MSVVKMWHYECIHTPYCWKTNVFTMRYGFSCAGLGAENQFFTCCGTDDYTTCIRQLLMKALQMDSFKFPWQLSLSVQRIIRLTCATTWQTFANL